MSYSDLKTFEPDMSLYSSGSVPAGSLVRIFDENGSDLNVLGLYVGLIIPDMQGIDVHDLFEDITFIDTRFKETTGFSRSNQFYYTLPGHWHHVILVGDRIVHLNTGFYTVTPAEE